MSDDSWARSRADGSARIGRRALVFGSAGLVVGAAGAEAANLAFGGTRGHAGPYSTDPPPDVDLMAEHGVLKRVLLCYQKALSLMATGERPPAVALHDSAEVVHEFIEAFHEALEEGFVFPRLRRAGQLVTTIGTLLVQHGRGRGLTQLIPANANDRAMSAAPSRQRVITAVTSFVRMYQPHEAREDTVVFPAFRALVGAEELSSLAARFAQLQRQQFGPGAFAQVVGRVADIERSLGIYDLGQFTPASVPT